MTQRAPHIARHTAYGIRHTAALVNPMLRRHDNTPTRSEHDSIDEKVAVTRLLKLEQHARYLLHLDCLNLNKKVSIRTELPLS